MIIGAPVSAPVAQATRSELADSAFVAIIGDMDELQRLRLDEDH